MPTTQEINDAREAVLGQVYQPAFYDKLASAGIVPQTDDEARELFKMAQALRHAAPAAAPVGNRFAAASSGLQQILGLSKQAHTDSYREAAVQLASDPALFKQAQLLHAELN